jgi:hypothetical protein
MQKCGHVAQLNRVLTAARLSRTLTAPVARNVAERTTQFLNVDVDVWSTSDLQPLITALGRHILVHYVGEERGAYSAHLSLASAYNRDADTRIRRLVALIDRLPPAARRLWDRARARDFNLGIQGGLAPFSHEIALEERTVALVAGVRGRIVITTYAVEQPERSRARRGPRPQR